MTEDSNPTDNGLAERVNGILKSEFIEPIQRTLDIEAATELVEQSIYTYNRVRSHRSLDMCTPAAIYNKE